MRLFGSDGNVYVASCLWYRRIPHGMRQRGRGTRRHGSGCPSWSHQRPVWTKTKGRLIAHEHGRMQWMRKIWRKKYKFFAKLTNLSNVSKSPMVSVVHMAGSGRAGSSFTLAASRLAREDEQLTVAPRPMSRRISIAILSWVTGQGSGVGDMLVSTWKWQIIKAKLNSMLQRRKKIDKWIYRGGWYICAARWYAGDLKKKARKHLFLNPTVVWRVAHMQMGHVCKWI